MNNLNSRLGRTAYTLIAIGLLALPAAVQADEVAAKRALAKAQYMLRTVSAEKATLEKDKAALEDDLKKLKAEIDKLKAQHEKKQTHAKQRFAKLKGMYEELRDKFIARNKEFRVTSNTLADTEQKLAVQTDNFETCYNNNKALFDINQEILGKYEGKGFWQVLSQKDPLIGLTQVKVENLVQDYQYKIDDLELTLAPENSEE